MENVHLQSLQALSRTQNSPAQWATLAPQQRNHWASAGSGHMVPPHCVRLCESESWTHHQVEVLASYHIWFCEQQLPLFPNFCWVQTDWVTHFSLTSAALQVRCCWPGNHFASFLYNSQVSKKCSPSLIFPPVHLKAQFTAVSLS